MTTCVCSSFRQPLVGSASSTFRVVGVVRRRVGGIKVSSTIRFYTTTTPSSAPRDTIQDERCDIVDVANTSGSSLAKNAAASNEGPILSPHISRPDDSPKINFSKILKDLNSRPDHLIRDSLTSNTSHLLNITLADYLPTSCLPNGFDRTQTALPLVNPRRYAPLPEGHHLVYWPTRVPTESLLADGTDTLHHPGHSFDRRLWVGGSLLFKNSTKERLTLNGQRASCRERVVKTDVRSVTAQERIHVTIERRYGRSAKLSNAMQTIKGELSENVRGEIDLESLTKDDEGLFGSASIIERRSLLFIRPKTHLKAERDKNAPDKPLRVSTVEPDFKVSLVPSRALLFRFSALTFNAHLIHLDPQYTREVEGHRNLLVHGPLTLVLMLSVLRSRLKSWEMIRTFTYKNLSPLYVDEKLEICVKVDEEFPDKWRVWILNGKGFPAVKASATIQNWRENESDEVRPVLAGPMRQNPDQAESEAEVVRKVVSRGRN